MNKPIPKREVAVDTVVPGSRYVTFWGSADAAEDMRQLGHVETTGMRGRYSLTVDARYDFNEVVEYIRGYG